MFSRREMLDRKESIDGRSARLKQTLREWRRQAAATGVYRSPDELAELEARSPAWTPEQQDPERPRA